MSAFEKKAALHKVANGATIEPYGKAKCRVGSHIVHVRFCSLDTKAPGKFKFNINPNTLSAEYELWICGSARLYYLIPVSLMRDIYTNPNAYVDKTHPEIRVVSVDARTHTATYASGGENASLRNYLGGRLFAAHGDPTTT